MPVFWGDIHNHCTVSYGKGTARRTLVAARRHLDFCSITGHAFWPDLPMDLETQSAIIETHLGGFAKLQYFWPSLLRELEEANRPGEFVAFPSYEWHSMQFGDRNCYFNAFDVPLIDAENPRELAAKLAEGRADFMILPHHCGYTRGRRGMNWDSFDERNSPIVEIFSNHGSGEADDSPYDYHHTMGPRTGESMVRHGLSLGYRFGFYAGTDSHDGYPGHYGHGCTGVLAPSLDLSSVWDKLKNRQTVASTGARMAAEMSLADASFGGETDLAAGSRLLLNIEGTAPIEAVDLVEGTSRGWEVRRLPGNPVSSVYRPGRHKIKVECGWGRFGKVSDWEIRVRVRKASLRGCQPCFRYSSYAMEEKTVQEEILECGETTAAWRCRAAANPAGMMGGTHFAAGGTQGVVLDVDAGEGAVIELETAGVALTAGFEDLVRGSVAQPISGFCSPVVKINRAASEAEFRFTHEEQFQPTFSTEDGWVYARVRQSDCQVAWISPIWFSR